MSDENNVNEANGDELEAMFAQAALEEDDETTDTTEAPSSDTEMHDPLSEMMSDEIAEEESEDSDEPEIDFISEAIAEGESVATSETTTDEGTSDVSEETATPDDETTSESPVSQLEDSILNAVELAHEAADLANDATEVASNTSVEMRTIIQNALQQIEESQQERAARPNYS